LDFVPEYTISRQYYLDFQPNMIYMLEDHKCDWQPDNRRWVRRLDQIRRMQPANDCMICVASYPNPLISHYILTAVK